MACGPFSIHALLAESDRFVTAFRGSVDSFLSTLSLRRATYDTYAKVLRVNFSIHALLAESDASHTNSPSKIINFLSTLSLRRATTAPRTGLTCGGGFFYPRSPCGERHAVNLHSEARKSLFYPRSPCGERRTQSQSLSA